MLIRWLSLVLGPRGRHMAVCSAGRCQRQQSHRSQRVPGASKGAEKSSLGGRRWAVYDYSSENCSGKG